MKHALYGPLFIDADSAAEARAMAAESLYTLSHPLRGTIFHSLCISWKVRPDKRDGSVLRATAVSRCGDDLSIVFVVDQLKSAGELTRAVDDSAVEAASHGADVGATVVHVLLIVLNLSEPGAPADTEVRS
jgi:hypothetical protein